jgi:uncharacterized SAM-binding protein YcdF (DUF218 family)
MKIRALVLICVAMAVFAAAFSGRFLVVNGPQKADVILVLAGETQFRPARALELLRQGYAPGMILNVPTQARIYQWSQTELAAKYVAGLPEAKAISMCAIAGLSTKDEALDSRPCLQARGAHRVLIVTSSYHTRRALSIFRHELPEYTFSIAAAHNPQEFGVHWWQHREWAKTDFYEWARLAWWEGVDRWRVLS